MFIPRSAASPRTVRWVEDGLLRIGIVGCGAAARLHLPAVSAAARTVVTAAIDVDQPSAEAIASATGADVFGSLEDGLASGTFDAVLVLLPHRAHEQAAVDALRAGQHVLLEKPMAPTLDACRRILAADEEAGRVLMVGENAQYWSAVRRTKELIDGDAIGEIVTARAWYCQPPIQELLGRDSWRLSRAEAGGGVAIDAGSHWLRPLRMWLGEIVEVIAVTRRPFPEMEGESMCRTLCRFGDDVIASFDVVLPPGPGVASVPLFQVTGTRGEIVVDLSGEVRLYDGSDPRGCVVGSWSYLQSFVDQFADFESAVLDAAQPAATAEHSVGEVRAVLAMYRSAQSGRWEPVW